MSQEPIVHDLSPDWECVTDRVMGGVSTARIDRVKVAGRAAARLRGRVSLENDGGFVQMAFDLRPDGTAFDASGWTGLILDLIGNGAEYELRLRTTDLSRPWQSYRHPVTAIGQWRSVELPFAEFEPHRTDAPFDPARLRRIGLLAVGSEMEADVAVARIGLFRATAP